MMQEWNGHRWDEIAAFLAVTEAGSFTGAAAALGRDASVVSRRVGALERRLGIRLFERTTRRVAPTEAGTRLAQRMRAAMTAMTEAEHEAQEASTLPQGLLRLTLPGAFGRMWIAPLLPAFLDACPGVRIEASYTDRYVDLVAEGYDMAIRSGALPDSTLMARKLADHRRLLVAAPAYLARAGTPRTPAELAGHACLLFTRLASYPEWHFRRRDRIETASPSGPLLSDDAPSLVRAAVAGQGIMMCSDWLAGRELASGDLVEIMTDWQVTGGGAIYLVRPSARFTAAKIRVFAEWIAARLSPPPWRMPEDQATRPPPSTTIV